MISLHLYLIYYYYADASALCNVKRKCQWRIKKGETPREESAFLTHLVEKYFLGVL